MTVHFRVFILNKASYRIFETTQELDSCTNFLLKAQILEIRRSKDRMLVFAKIKWLYSEEDVRTLVKEETGQYVF